jgi:hypothetical protein
MCVVVVKLLGSDALRSDEGYNDGFGWSLVKAQYLKEPLAVGSTNDDANHPVSQ